jgi:adenylate kinase
MHLDPAPDHHLAVVLLGSPGAGKGTVARRLEADFGYTHVDMGSILRQRAERGDALGRRIAIAQARGIMVPKETVISALCTHLGSLPQEARLVLDGFPRTAGQVSAADDGRVPVDVVLAICLDVSPEVAVERLSARNGLQSRPDDRAEVVDTRLDLIPQTVDAVRRLYEGRGILERVDAHGPPSEVYERVVACVQPAWSLA